MTDELRPPAGDLGSNPEDSGPAQDGGAGRARTILEGTLLVLGKVAIGMAVPILIVIVLAIVAQVIISH